MLALGRIIFALAIIGFGIVGLHFRDFTHNLQPVELIVPPSTPGYETLAIVSAFFLVGCGALLLFDQRRRVMGMTVAAFLASWVLFLQVPSAFHYPETLVSPWWVRTFEDVAMCGAAWILAGTAARPEVRSRRITEGHLLIGLALPVFGILHLWYGPGTARLIPAFYPFPLFLAYLTGATKIAAGVAILSGRLVKVAALMTALQYAIYVSTLHVPLLLAGGTPQRVRGLATSLSVAVAFTGLALLVAATASDRRASPAGAPLVR